MQKPTWQSLLSKEKKMSYFQNILTILHQKRNKGVTIYPKQKDIFNAFRFTNFKSVKVVIIGQDPYPRPNQAHGLAFSVLPGINPPPSLCNIYQELAYDIPEFTIPKHGFLKSWAKEGILLLNSILTVEHGNSSSHANIGWEKFTNKVIYVLNLYHKRIIFLLWGNYAQRIGNIINYKKHHVLTASHPSPISAHRGFFGCRHFSKTNLLLMQDEKKPIDWQLKITNNSTYLNN